MEIKKIEDTFNVHKDEPLYHYLDSFVAHKGLDKVTPRDLNKFIRHFGKRATSIAEFDSLYSIVITNRSNLIMTIWTATIGIMTFIIMIYTLLTYYK